MTKQEVYREMEGTLGLVPSFFKPIPERVIASEWDLFKEHELEEGVIPLKYRELIGLALSAAIVGAVILVVGGVVAYVGYGRVRSSKPAPDRTLNAVREDAEWLKNRMS